MYNEPQWATKPSNDYNWSLLEIKNGVECGIHKLTDPTTVLGRASDMVNITLAHESCSRQHARIAFDSQGYPWLRDLSSTHGTTCNKRKLPSEAIGKVESNSTKTGARGIMLFPGDVLQFGASSRLFCIQGPVEYERGTYKAKIQQQKQSLGSSNNSLSTIQQQQQQQQDKNTPFTSHNESGISWGMSMDDISEDDQQQQVSTDKTLPMELDVPEKHRKAFERLNAMKYKLSNMETEDMRIRRKGELSEGQERQLQRNEEREEQLKKSIVDLEEELYYKLYPEKAAAANKNKRKTNHKYDADGDDDDDFFDRTKQTEKDEIDDDGESQESLIVKWKAMYKQEQYRLETAIPKAKEDVSLLRDRLRKLEERGDDESAFFTKNDLDLANESLSKIHKQQSKCHETMDRIEHLLKIVNSKIVADRTTGYIGEGPPPPASSPPIKTTINGEGGDSSRKRSHYVQSPERQPEKMPPPPPPSTTIGSPSINEQKSMPPPTMGSRDGAAAAIEQQRSMPPPPISASMSRSSMAPPPTMPPPLMVKQDSNNYKSVVVGGGTGDPTIMPPPIMPPPTKRKRIVGPSMPPPPASFSSSSSPPPPPSASISSQPPSPKKQMTPNSAASGGSGGGSTLASIASMFQGENESSSASSSKANNNNGKSREEDSNTKKSKNAIGLKEDVWQAPKDQDGSGITKLNAKFAGRY